MKALSLRQPWAHAVIYYGKTIENRRWNTSFRGEFLIHAAKGMTASEYEDAEDFVAATLGWNRLPITEHHTACAKFAADFRERGKCGGIVGLARLVDVLPPCHTGERSLFAEDCRHLWHIPEQYGFVLEYVRPLPFTPWKGALGFFEVPREAVSGLPLVAT